MVKSTLLYITKFASTFWIYYFGILAIIGLAAPVGYYSLFIAHYLNYVDWLRASLLDEAKGLLVLAINKNWQMPLQLDHHTWFNIAAYTFIFILIYFYHMSSEKIFIQSNSLNIHNDHTGY